MLGLFHWPLTASCRFTCRRLDMPIPPPEASGSPARPLRQHGTATWPARLECHMPNRQRLGPRQFAGPIMRALYQQAAIRDTLDTCYGLLRSAILFLHPGPFGRAAYHSSWITPPAASGGLGISHGAWHAFSRRRWHHRAGAEHAIHGIDHTAPRRLFFCGTWMYGTCWDPFLGDGLARLRCTGHQGRLIHPRQPAIYGGGDCGMPHIMDRSASPPPPNGRQEVVARPCRHSAVRPPGPF